MAAIDLECFSNEDMNKVVSEIILLVRVVDIHSLLDRLTNAVSLDLYLFDVLEILNVFSFAHGTGIVLINPGQFFTRLT